MIPVLTNEQFLNNCRLIIQQPLNTLEIDEKGTLYIQKGWLEWFWKSKETSAQGLPASTHRTKKIKIAIVATIEAIRVEMLKKTPDSLFSIESNWYSLQDVIKKIDAEPTFKFSTKVQNALTRVKMVYDKLPKPKPSADNADVTDFVLLNETTV